MFINQPKAEGLTQPETLVVGISLKLTFACSLCKSYLKLCSFGLKELFWRVTYAARQIRKIWYDVGRLVISSNLEVLVSRNAYLTIKK